LSLLVPFLVGLVCITAICYHFLRRDPRQFLLVWLWTIGLFIAVLALELDPTSLAVAIPKNACIGLGVILLGAGWLEYGKKEGHLLAIVGWQALGVYWMMEVGNYLYLHPEDPTNVILYAPALALFSVFSIYEWKAYNGGEPRRSLKFIAGLTFVASGTYFLFAKVPPFATGLIWITAAQTSALVNLLGMSTSLGSPAYDPASAEILIPVLGSGISIILACTAIEAIVIFLGAFVTVEPRSDPWKAYKKLSPRMKRYQKMSGRERKARALLYTIVPIWVLNLVRNVAIIWIVNNTEISFEVAHGYIGKGFSFLVLLGLAMVVFDLVPEIYDDLLDLYRLGKPGEEKGEKGERSVKGDKGGKGGKGDKEKQARDKKPEKEVKKKEEEE